MTESDAKSRKQDLRLLKLLSRYGSVGLPIERGEEKIGVRSSGRCYNFPKGQVERLVRDGCLNTQGNSLAIAELGQVRLKRLLLPDQEQFVPDRDACRKTVQTDAVSHPVCENRNESPLGRLFYRRTKDGNSYISREEFEAGERLRKDFERGQLQPRISANLGGAIGSAGSRSGAGAVDISDFAMDARKRVNLAMDKLGPELSGVMLDICCFLKGLETVERERRWPPRSAKLMLKTGLSILARHYGFAGYENQRNVENSVWAASDYRPSMTSPV